MVAAKDQSRIAAEPIKELDIMLTQVGNMIIYSINIKLDDCNCFVLLHLPCCNPCLLQLVASLPVDIMPGCNDPANFSLPQQVGCCCA
jgi:DNA polymerase delta subunit 2